MWKATARRVTPFPKDRVDAWVNVHNVVDVITGFRGVSDRFPVAVDVPIAPFGRGKEMHGSKRYAAHPASAAAIAVVLRDPAPVRS